jgi:integrase
MAKYKKRPDGRYATSTIVGYTDDGKPKRKTLYGRTIMELDKKVAEFKSLQNKGIIINDEGMTVEQWGIKWLKLYKSAKEYNTYAMYLNALNSHIIPEIGGIRLSALKSHHIQEMLNDIISVGHYRTAEIVRLTIKQIIQQAIINEYIYKDVSLKVSLPQSQKKEKRSLSNEEKAIFEKAKLTQRERVFVDLLYYTGVRRGEALALTVKDIDFKNRRLIINKNLVIKDGESHLKNSPKTNAGNRSIPLPAKLLSELQEYIAHAKNIYLFTMKSGEPMTKSSFRRFWYNILDKMNVAAGGDEFSRSDTAIRLIAKDVTPHIFRHTYATNLYYAGIDAINRINENK